MPENDISEKRDTDPENTGLPYGIGGAKSVRKSISFPPGLVREVGERGQGQDFSSYVQGCVVFKHAFLDILRENPELTAGIAQKIDEKLGKLVDAKKS